MKLLIEKISGKPFPPPFEGLGLTAVATGITENPQDPKHRQAYVIENGSIVNCCCCRVIKELE